MKTIDVLYPISLRERGRGDCNKARNVLEPLALRERGRGEGRRHNRIPLRDARGFSLVEIVATIGIMSILMAIATLGFSHFNQKYRVDSQVKQMQADFDNIRISAVTTKKSYTIVLNPSSYAFVSYSSEGDPGTPAGGMQVRYPLQKFVPGGSGSYSAFNNTPLSIDARGCLTGTAAPFYVAVSPGDTNAGVNALAVQTAKTNIGFIQGGSCELR